MSKGEETRAAILDTATRLATRVGLEGLTIGALAAELNLSKSGLFAHFQSKERLQVEVLEHATQLFVDEVIKPAFRAPRGVPRLRSLFEHWLAWEANAARQGCLFIAAASELDDRPGSARDALVKSQRDWHDTLVGAVELAVREGHFRKGTDAQTFAQELWGIVLALHHLARLLGDEQAFGRARAAFDALVARASVR